MQSASILVTKIGLYLLNIMEEVKYDFTHCFFKIEGQTADQYDLQMHDFNYKKDMQLEFIKFGLVTLFFTLVSDLINLKFANCITVSLQMLLYYAYYEFSWRNKNPIVHNWVQLINMTITTFLYLILKTYSEGYEVIFLFQMTLILFIQMLSQQSLSANFLMGIIFLTVNLPLYIDEFENIALIQ